MALGKLLMKLVDGSDGTPINVYECSDCGETFESAKDPDRAACPACLATAVSQVGTKENYS